MKFLTSKYPLVLTGLLFVFSVSLDPFNHGFSEHHHELAEVECQFCENEVFDTNQSKSKLAKASYLTVFKIEINQLFISYLRKYSHSRAPPKN